MAHPTKIATCCFCGSRTMLKPTANKGHELACGSCGAPLHNMKWLKSPEPARPAKQPKSYEATSNKYKSKHREKRRKKRPSMFKKIFEEAWDIAEDIFD